MERINPYQPVAGVADAEMILLEARLLEWAGHRFSITAEQIPVSLWLVARVIVTIDGNQVESFIKWRWHKRASWIFPHEGKSCTATIWCSGANQIQCRLKVEGFAVGEAIVPAAGFWLGTLTVLVITGVSLSSALYLLRT